MPRIPKPRTVATLAWLFAKDAWKPLCLLALLTTGTVFLIARQTHKADFHARWSKDTTVPALTPSERNEIITERWKRYGSDSASMALTVKLMLSFIVVAFIVVTNKNPTVTIPWIGASVPTSWLYLVVPVALVYLWLNFGFLLNEVINSRALLWLLQPPSDPNAWPPFTVRSLLDDNNFGDGYFLTSVRDLESIREQMHWINRVALAGYVAVLTLSHAVALGMVYLGMTRAKRAFRSSGICLFAAICLIFAGSHYQFWTGGPDPNVAQIWMAWLVVPCWIAFTFVGWKARRQAHPAKDGALPTNTAPG